MGLPSLSCNAPYTVLFTVDTVTSQVAETSGDRVEVAVITHWPFSTAVTTPLEFTTATPLSDVVHWRTSVTHGSTVAWMVRLLPLVSSSSVGFRVMDSVFSPPGWPMVTR